MKILNVCYDDHANFMHDNANALRSVGVDCLDVKMVKHPFSYPSQATVVNEEQLIKAIAENDLIQIFHSEDFALKYCKGKRVIVYHTGTRYRQRPGLFNDLFNPIVERSIIALPELMGKGAKNEVYLVGAIDTERITPIKTAKGERVIVGHFPSNQVVKGTETINKIVNELKREYDFEYIHSTEILQYKEQLSRLQQCDVYIELLAPMQGNKPYGSFGITALEAACMGKVVLTQNILEGIYAGAYETLTPFVKYHDESEFKRMLSMILKRENLEPLKQITREWVVQNHSYQATGNKLKQVLGL